MKEFSLEVYMHCLSGLLYRGSIEHKFLFKGLTSKKENLNKWWSASHQSHKSNYTKI